MLHLFVFLEGDEDVVLKSVHDKGKCLADEVIPESRLQSIISIAVHRLQQDCQESHLGIKHLWSEVTASEYLPESLPISLHGVDQPLRVSSSAYNHTEACDTFQD